MNNSKSKVMAAGLLVSFMGIQAFGADLQWTGRYRVEGNYINNFQLNKNVNVEDSYIVHHLIMEPKIIATDGFNIKSRFDIFNSPLTNDQHGQVFGSYTGAPNQAAGSPTPPAVLTNTQQSETLQVTELYFNWINEFGALVAGRVPFHFGLGMTYNAGEGNFDHYLSTKDIVGYKLVLGNLTIMPAYGKVHEGFLTNEDDVNDYMIMAEYVNPESDLSFGVIFDQRNAPIGTPTNSPNATTGNDFPTTYWSQANSNFGNASVAYGFSAYNINFYLKKKMENFNFGLEAGFVNGSTGISVVHNGAPDPAQIASYGGAAEIGYRTGSIKLNLRAGLASGDDPDTTRLESYAFNPNYRVAMMMFTFPMGQYDILHSGLYGTRPAASAAQGSTLAQTGGLDTEVISNALYFAPNVTWSLGDRYDVVGTFCYANELKSPVSAGSPPAGITNAGSEGSSLGFETDFGLNYHPNDKFTWETTIGIFFPGSAWQLGGQLPSDVAYGATSKAAINF